MVRINNAYDLNHWLLVLFFLAQLCIFVSSSDASEIQTLLKFKSFLSNDTALDNWNNSTNPCNGTTNIWSGLYCEKNGKVYGLKLQNMGLMGIIDIDTLSGLSALRSISIMNNNFEGPLPSVNKIGALIGVYLSNNQFTGEIPEIAFEGMNQLKNIYLDGNEFSGEIPSSLAALPKLTVLDLQGNQFSGEIPNFPQDPNGWKHFNVSNNQLEGPIPASLSNLDASAFVGNKGLCGKPLTPCKSSMKWINSF
ncbi:PREDICTED: pollen receptor kinase [Prunus dulcis]|uniref:PREDICTED: pollen receptor kinase n=1 Tax=Prunus dulcis TaxID=3755 RepID=A0A5E4ELW9_PRUDU|nr:pollen receptor-like kinase 4 [Prunus dulcis]VVA14908.1 PREDICTED: pollen receptor kinase [Prunus dulcis]VVA14909.1 PREDICTED: pollen receptor kinase [Prunus dulcis]